MVQRKWRSQSDNDSPSGAGTAPIQTCSSSRASTSQWKEGAEEEDMMWMQMRSSAAWLRSSRLLAPLFNVVAKEVGYPPAENILNPSSVGKIIKDLQTTKPSSQQQCSSILLSRSPAHSARQSMVNSVLTVKKNS